MIVAVITARGGSKRIPGKNIRAFAGEPVIHYSIRAARESGLFDRIVVSTDSAEIAAVANAAGAETPFLRDAALSNDFATTADTLADALERLGGAAGLRFACCIYPVAPFLRPQDLRRGLDILRDRDGSCAFAVAPYPSPVFRALVIDERGAVKMIWPEYRDRRSNDLPQAFRDAGQFYWVDAARFLRERVLYGDAAYAVPLPAHLAHDIDTPEDWRLAELVHHALRLEETS